MINKKIFDLLTSEVPETKVLRNKLKVDEIKQLANYLATEKTFFITENEAEKNIDNYENVPIINVWTDGSCLCNPGAGGWGAIIKIDKDKEEISGGASHTTNNRMELTAVIQSLKYIKENIKIDSDKKIKINLTTDSKYVCDSINKGWVYSWKNNDWKKSDGKQALNIDLWKQLLMLFNEYDVTFSWIKGHAGHLENERCDALAVNQSKKMQALNLDKTK